MVLSGLFCLLLGFAAPSPTSAAPESVELQGGREAEALYEAGVSAFKAQDFARATSLFSEALSIAVTPEALYARAQAYGKLGRCDEANADYRQVGELLPEDHSAQALIRDAVFRCANDSSSEHLEQHPQLVVLQPLKPIPIGTDPGRRPRVAGFTLLALGATSSLLGVSLATIFAVKTRDFNSSRTAAEQDYVSFGCETSTQFECEVLREEIDVWHRNSRVARQFAIIGGASGVGLGVVGLVTGGLLLREGRLRTRQWQSGRSVAWRVGPTGNGVTVFGRF
jgi:hypothetical protein